MEELLRELEQSVVLRQFLRGRVPRDADSPGCFLCRLILEDLEANGKLTGYPNDYNRDGIFPVKSKLAHIEIERKN